MNLEVSYVKKFIKPICIILLIVSIVFSIFKINNSPASSIFYDTNPAHNLVIQDKNDSLSNSTIPKFYIAFQDRLRDFITMSDGSVSEVVVVKSVESPIREGTTTTVTVDIPSLKISNIKITFDVESGIFSIPAMGYSTSLEGTAYN